MPNNTLNTQYVDSVDQKMCTQCKKILPITSFGKRGYNKKNPTIKRSAACYKCHYRKYIRSSTSKKYEWVRAIKLERGCIDCGYNAHPEALEFDHISDNKRFTIGEMLHNYSKANIMLEIEKCEVVCSNCHAIRTANRRVRKEIGDL